MDQLLVALDFDNAEAALRLADCLRGAVGGFKVGSQLYTSCGPSVVDALTRRGDRVFLDLKFHDIPNTVAKAVATPPPTTPTALPPEFVEAAKASGEVRWAMDAVGLKGSMVAPAGMKP